MFCCIAAKIKGKAGDRGGVNAGSKKKEGKKKHT